MNTLEFLYIDPGTGGMLFTVLFGIFGVIVFSLRALLVKIKFAVGRDKSAKVSGDKIQAVPMLPGYTHNIINLSDTENLVTVMWANEQFDPNKPDTFFEKV